MNTLLDITFLIAHPLVLSYLSFVEMELEETSPRPSCFSSFSTRIFKSAKVDAKVNMELYIKSGPNDGEIGDCPFAQYVRCVLAYKGIDCQVSL